MKSAVIVFPGSNCDRDLKVALREVTGREPAMIWHRESALPDGIDLIGVPGGFSYGDYLRSGAMAARSPVMRAVAEAAGRGAAVLGVCNGFQILTEAGLLPGALMRNSTISFVCRDVGLSVENSQLPFTSRYEAGERITIPVAHHDGNYQADAETLDRLEGEGRIVALVRHCHIFPPHELSGNRAAGPAVSYPTASSRPSNSRRPSVRPWAGSTARSGWGMRPSTLPRSLRMPAMWRAEPLTGPT